MNTCSITPRISPCFFWPYGYKSNTRPIGFNDKNALLILFVSLFSSNSDYIIYLQINYLIPKHTY